MNTQFRAEVRLEAVRLSHKFHESIVGATPTEIFKYAGAIADFVFEEDSDTREVENRKYVEILLEASINPSSFAKLCSIYHPLRGCIPYEPHGFQEEVLDTYWNNRSVINAHARQMGITTVNAIFCLWFAAFSPDQTVLIASNTYQNSLEILDRVRLTVEKLPSWLQVNVIENRKGLLKFENGSRIFARAVGPDLGRGMAFNLVLIDNAPYISHSVLQNTWSSLAPALSCCGRRIILSGTPSSSPGLFDDIWHHRADFAKIHLPYTRHPDRAEEWAARERTVLGDERFSQEYEAKFP